MRQSLPCSTTGKCPARKSSGDSAGSAIGAEVSDQLIDAGEWLTRSRRGRWMVSRGYVDDPLAARYVDFLLGRKMPEAAARDWSSYAAGRSDGYPDRNRVFNGDFETRPDWICIRLAIYQNGGDINRLRSGSEAQLATGPCGFASTEQQILEISASSNGCSCQRDGTALEHSCVLRTCRRIKGWPFALFTTTRLGNSIGQPAPCVGRTSGRYGKGNLKRRQAGGLVSVRLVRRPSLKFDNLLKGTAWVDGVVISPDNAVTVRRINLRLGN